MIEEEHILQEAKRAVYLQPEMIEFLLVENLALRTLLHEKGLITPEELQEHTKRAKEILEASVMDKIREQAQPFKSILVKAGVNLFADAGPSS